MSPGLARRLGGAALALALTLLLSGPGLLVGLGAVWNTLEGRPGAPVVCEYRARTGRACPGCGGTQALRLAAEGRFGTAFRHNPLGAWVGLCLWAGVLAGACAVALGRVPAARQAAVLILTAGGVAGIVTMIWWWRGTGPG